VSLHPPLSRSRGEITVRSPRRLERLEAAICVSAFGKFFGGHSQSPKFSAKFGDIRLGQPELEDVGGAGILP
jgi:hypothetical protein